MPKKTRAKRKEKKNILNGVVHIQSTFNNTIVTIRKRCILVQFWSSGIQRIPEKYPFCSTDDSSGCG